MISGVIYVSEATCDFSEDQLKVLAAEFVKKNRQMSITGYFCYVNGHFLQYIEGTRAAISTLMGSIRADHRHKIAFEYWLASSSERLFEQWFMTYLSRKNKHEHRFELCLETIMLMMVKSDFVSREGTELLLVRHLESVGHICRLNQRQVLIG